MQQTVQNIHSTCDIVFNLHVIWYWDDLEMTGLTLKYNAVIV